MWQRRGQRGDMEGVYRVPRREGGEFAHTSLIVFSIRRANLQEGVCISEQGTTSWEIQQQQDAIRSVYQRAVVIPLANVEQLWREYDQFENKLNKVTVSLRACPQGLLEMTEVTPDR